MTTQLAALLIAALHVLSGCTTPAKPSVATRRQEYENLLASVKPRMTRSQLYKILPPSRIPNVTPPNIISWSTTSSVDFTPLTEYHPLNDGFRLVVYYQIFDRKDYANAITLKPSPSNPNARIVEALPLTSKVRSRENPKDVIIERPTLLGPGIRRTTLRGVLTSDYNAIYADTRWRDARAQGVLDPSDFLFNGWTPNLNH